MTVAMDDDEAIRWAIRLDCGSLEPAEQAQLETWLAGDERRRGALLRAEAALAYLDRGRALGSRESIGEEPSPALPRLGRRTFLVGGVIGSLSAAGLAGFLIWPDRGMQNVRTVIGEVRRVPLADGSFASLNTASRVEVAFGDQRRTVRLEEGEVWFQVAHDPARPFIVEAGDVRVQAVGTAFSVRRREAGAEILVTEGTVDTWVAGREPERRRVAAGARAFASDAAEIEITEAPDAVDRALAWRVGDIALNGEPLSYAVGEINRYNHIQLVVVDPALAGEPLVGYFRANEPENFARAVADMTGARTTSDGTTIRLDR